MPPREMMLSSSCRPVGREPVCKSLRQQGSNSTPTLRDSCLNEQVIIPAGTLARNRTTWCLSGTPEKGPAVPRAEGGDTAAAT